MKSLSTSFLILATGMLLGACSSDSNGTGSAIAPETGSSSLMVNAEVNGSDAGSGLFTTGFKVTIADSLGAAVNNATVTISHATLGTINIAWDTLQAGIYTASLNGYSTGTYTLDVTRGAEFLSNGRVFAPDLHVITFPTLTDTIAINLPITALWTRQSAAQIVEVETRDLQPTLASSVGDSDDGSFIIPASSTPRDDQRIRIKRSNVTTLTKGMMGSTFKAEIRNAVEPLVVI